MRPQVDGKILSIDFKEGQDVKRGDVLAHDRSRHLPGAARPGARQEGARRGAAHQRQARPRALPEAFVERWSPLKQQIDTQRALVAQHEAQVKSDEAAIENARAILGYTTVVAPIDGRTGLRLVDVGNLVRASDAGIVVITEVRPISVLFTLPQQQLPQINKARAERRARWSRRWRPTARPCSTRARCR